MTKNSLSFRANTKKEKYIWLISLGPYVNMKGVLANPRYTKRLCKSRNKFLINVQNDKKLFNPECITYICIKIKF